MRKNYALAFILLFGACKKTAADPSPRLQGVVELDERVLAFELPGRVVELTVDRGAPVEPGATIARIDDALERPLRESAQGEVDAARAQVALLEAGTRVDDIHATEAQLRGAKSSEDTLGRTLSREQELLRGGVSSTARVDELQGQVNRAVADRQALEAKLSVQRKGARKEEIAGARSRLAAAEQSLAARDARLGRFTLVSPMHGRILEVHARPGEMVNAGAPVVTLGDTHHPFVDVFVPEGEVGGIHVGLPAAVRVDSEPTVATGTVENVGRKTEFTPRFLFSDRERPNLVIRVRVRVDDPGERLHAGVPAFVTLSGAGEKR